jgi:hypothetical protein
MKKWLILAVIAAMFAVVTFVACGGGDDGGGSGVAENAEILVDGDGKILNSCYGHVMTTDWLCETVQWCSV